MMIPMELREIQIGSDPYETQVLILGEREGDRTFPIFIGHNEAMAMDHAVRSLVSVRPMTHDLVMNTIESMNGILVEVQVDDLRDSTFFGKLVVQISNGERVLVDSRPSDALVLAMKSRVPIYVEESVLSAVTNEQQKNEDDDIDDEEEENSF